MADDSKVNFQLIFENLPGLYLILSPDFEILAVSKTYLKATLTQRDNLIGKNLFEVFPDNPDDNQATGTSNLRASLQRVLSRKVTDTMAVQKYDVRREDGGFEEKHWSPVNFPVLDAHGELKYIIHNVVDVTDFIKLKKQGIEQYEENKQLRKDADQQEKILQAQKLEALGRLIGGIAHDFNTILTLIMVYCESGLSGIENSQEALIQIQKASGQANSLIKELMAFSRYQPVGNQAVNLNTIFKNLQSILKKAVPANVQYQLQLDPDLGNTLANPGQIEQIIMNLTINAVHAMPKGGTLSIETANVSLDKMKAQGNPKCEPGNYVMISVSDTGVGMSAETQARIFEPFYTTKAIGKGTGLGLATIHSIVTQNKGTIWVFSRLGEGTRFEIFLPLTLEQEIPQEKTPMEAIRFHGSETILLVEDTIELRKLFARTLSSYGYHVIEAADGLSALNIYESEANSIDLIITDGIMPKMSGLEFASRVRTKHSKQKIIFLSGYLLETLEDHRIDMSYSLFVEKPVSSTALLAKIRSLLDAPEPG